MNNPLTLFQIGDVRLNLVEQTWHGYSLISNASSERISGGKFVWSNTRYQPEVNQVTVEGYWLMDDFGGPDDKLAAVSALVGFPTQIFAYREESADFTLWLVTSGTLMEAELKEESRGLYTGYVKVEFGPHWYPVDRTLWLFSGGERSLVTGGTTITPYPRQKELQNPYHRWVRVERGLGSIYDPDQWVDEPLDWRYPSIGQRQGWGNIDRHHVFVDKRRWNVPPHSVYFFKSLNPTGSLTLTVHKTKNLYNVVTESTSVDLTALDTLLSDNGYTGLLPTDILVIGEVSPAPGFIYRDGTVLSVVPEVIYADEYPGYLDVGDTTVYLNGYGQAAWRHTFRRF